MRSRRTAPRTFSCRTNASRSAGSVSSTTSSARPTQSASASCSGSVPSARSTIGSGMRTSKDSSRRDRAERGMFGDRATTVVSQRARFSTSSASIRLRRSHVSWTASVGLAQGAEHPVSHRAHPGSVLLELLRQELGFHPSVTSRRRGTGPYRGPRDAGDLTLADEIGALLGRPGRSSRARDRVAGRGSPLRRTGGEALLAERSLFDRRAQHHDGGDRPPGPRADALMDRR